MDLAAAVTLLIWECVKCVDARKTKHLKSTVFNGCACVLEAAPWWKTKRGKPFDTRCQECVRCVSTGWPFEDWYTVVARAKSNADFAATVQEAREFMRKTPPPAVPKFTMQSFETQRATELACERSLLFCPVPEFQSTFGIAPSQIPGVVVETHHDERGKEIQGVVMKDHENPFRTLSPQRTQK
eukprot:1964700-Amphidinium_carterae.1